MKNQYKTVQLTTSCGHTFDYQVLKIDRARMARIKKRFDDAGIVINTDPVKFADEIFQAAARKVLA